MSLPVARIRNAVDLPLRTADGFATVATAYTFDRLVDGREHLALQLGEPCDAVPLVRLHSECLTGDVLGSARCDCGPQLDEALRRIHEAGGLVLCQDESSAYFDGMPRSARDTGVVDFVLPPAQMHGVLLDHVRAPDARRKLGDRLLPGRSYGLTSALRFLQEAYGIDFTHYKPSTVVRRIERRQPFAIVFE